MVLEDGAIVLTVNAGSSSLRVSAFRLASQALQPYWHQRFEGTTAQQLAGMTERLQALKARPQLVAHRIVQGGASLDCAQRVDARLLKNVEAAIELAPLHDPQALQAYRTSRELLPDTPQVFVPDSGFFVHLPAAARSYALPQALVDEFQLHRYGFHGLAHESMWRGWCAAGGAAWARIISLQLGGGCSAALIEGGKPRATSMGMTPLAGLVMATRSGDVDPGLILYLIKHAGFSAEQLERLLYRESGLLGLSGCSGDVSKLLTLSSAAPQLALATYVERIRHFIGAYMAIAGGIDGIVFGGGVGENLPAVRAAVLGDMAWCGLAFDGVANAAAIGHAACISHANSTIDVRVHPVDEERLLAEQAVQALVREPVEA